MSNETNTPTPEINASNITGRQLGNLLLEATLNTEKPIKYVDVSVFEGAGILSISTADGLRRRSPQDSTRPSRSVEATGTLTGPEGAADVVVYFEVSGESLAESARISEVLPADPLAA